jgi:hypothetical protein
MTPPLVGDIARVIVVPWLDVVQLVLLEIELESPFARALRLRWRALSLIVER